MPHKELADGILILVGGLLMLTPGFVLDTVGAICILPFTRPIGRRFLSGVISRRLIGVTYPARSRSPVLAERWASYAGNTGTQQRPGPDDGVVQGEVVD